MFLVTVLPHRIMVINLIQVCLYKNIICGVNTEEDFDLENQYRVKNLPDPISIREAALKNYVDNKT